MRGRIRASASADRGDRGLAVPLSIFAAMFVLAAFLFILLDPAMGPLYRRGLF